MRDQQDEENNPVIPVYPVKKYLNYYGDRRWDEG